MISARTKAALAAAKRRGVKLGGDRGAGLTAKARAAGNAAQQARAQARASDLTETVKELQAAGCESSRAIAAELDARGIPAARGGNWSAAQVSRLLARVNPSTVQRIPPPSPPLPPLPPDAPIGRGFPLIGGRPVAGRVKRNPRRSLSSLKRYIWRLRFSSQRHNHFGGSPCHSIARSHSQ